MKNVKEQLKNILNITKYSIKMYFRDKSAVYFSLFIPLLIMSIFGLLNFDRASSVKIGVVDLADNQVSHQVLDGMKKIDTLKITTGSESDEVSELKNSNRDIVLVLPKDFGANIAATKVQKVVATNPIATQDIKAYINEGQTNGNVQIGITVLDKIFDGVTHQVAGTPSLFSIKQESVSTRKLTYIDFVIPGVAAMSVMQMSVFAVVGAIVSWRERGILKRLLATPIKPSNIVFSQVVTRLIITLMQISVLFAVGIFAFHLQIVGNIFLVYFIAVLGGIVFLNMGFALSGAASTQNTVMALGNLIIMPQMFLSGVFFPREALPSFMQNITQYFPLTYLSHGMREVMIHGATAYQIRNDLIGLVVWAVIIFFIAAKSFRWE